MRKILLTKALVILSLALYSQSITGIWKTIDDVTGEAKSHVEIFEKENQIYGRVVKLLQSPEDTICEVCPGERKNQKVLGMEILTNLKSYKDYWSYGKILDPVNGKEYKCNVWLKDEDKLVLRGYIGISVIGRSQEWTRVK